MRRFLYPAGLAAALCFPLAGSIGVQAANYAGHWRLTLATSCADSAQNASVCRFIIGKEAAIGKSGTTLAESGSDTLTAAANGRYTDAAVVTLAERAPGAKTTACPLNTLATTLFNGSCTLTWTGSGHVIVKNGLPVFYTDSETLRYHNKVIGTVKGAAANTGFVAPAKPGTYGASWAARQAGAGKAPAGFSFRFTVARSG